MGNEWWKGLFHKAAVALFRYESPAGHNNKIRAYSRRGKASYDVVRSNTVIRLCVKYPFPRRHESVATDAV